MRNNQKYCQLEAKYFKDIKETRKDAKEQARIEYQELYDAKFNLFDIEKQEMYDQMKELKDKIRELGSEMVGSDNEINQEKSHPKRRESNSSIKIHSSSRISQYKTMIQDKFKVLAEERSQAIAENMGLKKEIDHLESGNKDLMFDNESIKQNVDRLKTDIKHLEVTVKSGRK